MDSNRIIIADLNEILFEGRNKSYGAYAMRTQGHLYLMRAALVALLLFVVATATPLFIRWFSAKAIIPVKEIPVEDWSVVNINLPPSRPRLRLLPPGLQPSRPHCLRSAPPVLWCRNPLLM
jgi:protein TonB